MECEVQIVDWEKCGVERGDYAGGRALRARCYGHRGARLQVMLASSHHLNAASFRNVECALAVPYLVGPRVDVPPPVTFVFAVGRPGEPC